MTLSERFSPERLITTACEEAGSDDFGESDRVGNPDSSASPTGWSTMHACR